MDFIFDREEYLNLEKSLRYEWLETNGIGGYANSTIVGCHTRKYHGALVAQLPELGGKFVLLSKLEPSVRVNGHIFRFSTNKFPGVFDPTGHKYIDSFEAQICPEHYFRVGDIRLKQSFMMLPNENTVIYRFEVLNSEKPFLFNLEPFLAYRENHALTQENMYLRVKTFMEDNSFKVDPYDGMPPLYFDLSKETFFHAGPYWRKRLEYLKERARGFEYQEDNFCPGLFEQTIEKGDVVFFRASLTKDHDTTAEEAWEKEYKSRQQKQAQYKSEPNEIAVLKYHGEHFIVGNDKGDTSIVAGYPWFVEWGRDTMIALPGLILETNQKNSLALKVLKSYLRYEKDGLIPNYLPIGENQPSYNSADAAMWFMFACSQYLEKSGDEKGFEKDLLPAMIRILNAYADSKPADVWYQDSGLLWVGNEHTQLTWMDAQVHGVPVTPRYGMPIEINSLWIHGLAVAKKNAKKYKVKFPKQLDEALKAAKANFLETFWSEELGYFADVVNQHGRDFTVRPNQCVAGAISDLPVLKKHKKSMLQVIERELVTPFGLRTLSPADPRYCPIYSGPPEKRDAAYHQGTVWPWLIGHYTALALAAADRPAVKAKKLYENFENLFSVHLKKGCLGGLSEIYDGDPPHFYRGCFSQAWSVGETIRAWNMIQERSN